MRELTLDEMLNDPIVQLVMQRDGVSDADIRALAAVVHHQSRRCPTSPLALEDRAFAPAEPYAWSDTRSAPLRENDGSKGFAFT